MKRIKRKIKEITSRPTKNLKKIKQAILVFAESSLHKKTASLTRQPSMKPNFSLEEEAAHLAYRQGWEVSTNNSYLANSQLDTDTEEDFTPEPVENKEINVRERDPMIEKLEKKVGISEKEGWEAIYT